MPTSPAHSRGASSPRTPSAATDVSPSRIVPVTIAGPVGPLEGLIQEREPGTARLAVMLCHPHPLYGGTMHNKVVHRAASTLHDLGAAVLRFNFRGAGKSAGRHDRGVGELDDARAALDFLRARHPSARRWVGGFSFGSWVAARLGAGAAADVERLILIAPPVGTSSFSVLRTTSLPKLVIQGTRDTVCPLERLEAEFPTWAEPRTLVKVDGATHFFDGKLAQLAKALVEALGAAVTGGTSSDA